MSDLIILNPNLINYNSHDFHYDFALVIAAEREKLSVKIIGNIKGIKEISSNIDVAGFKRTIWHWFLNPATVPRVFLMGFMLLNNLLFAVELMRVFQKTKLKNNQIVFCHMITHNQILAWSFWYLFLKEKSRPKLVLLFRYSADWFDNLFSKWSFKLLSSIKGNVKFCTDSEKLSKDYQNITNSRFSVIPIPVSADNNKLSEESNKPKNSIILSSVGSPRLEKGFLEIVEAIKIVENSKKLRNQKYIIQIENNNNSKIYLAINELKKIKNFNIEFILGPLNSSDYFQMFIDSDIIILPYWQDIYKSRTSGIFAEALAYGKPVIVTEDTWMSDQLNNYGSGLAVKDRDGMNLAKKILEIVSDFDTFQIKALKSQNEWRKKHNSQKTLLAIIN